MFLYLISCSYHNFEKFTISTTLPSLLMTTIFSTLKSFIYFDSSTFSNIVLIISSRVSPSSTVIGSLTIISSTLSSSVNFLTNAFLISPSVTTPINFLESSTTHTIPNGNFIGTAWVIVCIACRIVASCLTKRDSMDRLTSSSYTLNPISYSEP